MGTDCQWDASCNVKNGQANAMVPIFRTVSTAVSATMHSCRRSQDLANAKSFLLWSGVLTERDFQGVSISSCSFLDSGTWGFTASATEVKVTSVIRHLDAAMTLYHEMVHASQYRRWGVSGFACRYAEAYVACSGCQNAQNTVENEAYSKTVRACDMVKAKCSRAKKSTHSYCADLLQYQCSRLRGGGHKKL